MSVVNAARQNCMTIFDKASHFISTAGDYVDTLVNEKIASGDTPAAKQLDAYKFEKYVFNTSQVLAISLIALRLLGFVSMPWMVVGSTVLIASYLIMKTATDIKLADLFDLTLDGHRKLPKDFNTNSWEIKHNDNSFPLWRRDIRDPDFVQASLYPNLTQV